MAVAGRVFIYGGKGALGAACVNHFKTQNWVSVQLIVQNCFIQTFLGVLSIFLKLLRPKVNIYASLF